MVEQLGSNLTAGVKADDDYMTTVPGISAATPAVVVDRAIWEGGEAAGRRQIPDGRDLPSSPNCSAATRPAFTPVSANTGSRCNVPSGENFKFELRPGA